MKEYTTKAPTGTSVTFPIKSKAADTICLPCINDMHDLCHKNGYAWSSCTCWQEWDNAGRPE